MVRESMPAIQPVGRPKNMVWNEPVSGMITRTAKAASVGDCAQFP
jgi:hypothetical protein